MELRLPKLTGNDHEQLMQLKSYLYQHLAELQYIITQLETDIEKLKKEK